MSGCLTVYLALLNLERCYSIPGKQPVIIRAVCVIRIIIDRHIFSTACSKKRCGENGHRLFVGTVMSERKATGSQATAQPQICDAALVGNGC